MVKITDLRAWRDRGCHIEDVRWRSSVMDGCDYVFLGELDRILPLSHSVSVLIVSVSDITCCALSHSMSVLIVSVLSFCVYVLVLCLFRILPAVCCLILCLCSLCLCSCFVSICVCLLIHSVPHRVFACIVLCGIVLHLYLCAQFFLVLCMFVSVCLFVLCRIVYLLALFFAASSCICVAFPASLASLPLRLDRLALF